MIITFNELRRIKDRLPSGSSQRIADELGIDVDTVRNYFGGKHESKECVGVHFEPGPDGGVVTLDDTTILDVAMRILSEQRSYSDLSGIRRKKPCVLQAFLLCFCHREYMKHSAVPPAGYRCLWWQRSSQSGDGGSFSLFVRPSPWERPLERRGLFAARQPAGFLLPFRSPQPPRDRSGFCAFCLSRTHPSRRVSRRTTRPDAEP